MNDYPATTWSAIFWISHSVFNFVGGVRGLEELEKRVNSGEMQVAFAMHPVSMSQLIEISDRDMIMPPKVTWFVPKLRSGMFVYSLEN